MKNNLSERWIKASITGTIWAASEIVLGSFLHNLRIPFSGNILTAIGLIILISVSYIWNDKGLFWRAGLICAVMKTMSPSAVIFGPMIAIFGESLLLELSVMALGRNIFGFMTGAILAMSSNLIHKIVTYIISYGMNIVEVYTNLVRFAQKQMDISTDIVWLPVIFLLVVYSLFGIFSAAVGMKVGRRLLEQPGSGPSATSPMPPDNPTRQPGKEFPYSVAWLFLDIFLIVLSFVLMNRAPWMVWSSTILVIVAVWAVRYKRGLRQLKRPGFWIFFVLITLLATIVFARLRPGGGSLWEALLTGIQMNFRAVVIIVGFAVLGTELYNPVIRKYFMRSSFRSFPLALELSVESLPAFIASVPDLKTLLRDPVSVFHRVISEAGNKLAALTREPAAGRRVLLVTGPVASGKTTFVKELAMDLRRNNMRVGGFYCERIMEGSVTTGYDIVDAATGERALLMRQGEGAGSQRVGRFTISEAGLGFGRSILNSPDLPPRGPVIIDEVGALELGGGGWAGTLGTLLARKEIHLILTARDSNLGEIRKKWALDEAMVYDVTGTGRADLQDFFRNLPGNGETIN